MPPKSKTKHWNTSPELMTEECLYIDWRDEGQTVVNNYKLRSQLDRARLWIQAHRDHTEFKTAKWEVRSADVVTMRTGSHNRTFGSVVVKFHLQSGVITIQGAAKDSWKSIFGDLKEKVEIICRNDPPNDLDTFITDLCKTDIRQRTISQMDFDDSLEIEDDPIDSEHAVFQSSGDKENHENASSNVSKQPLPDSCPPVSSVSLDALQTRYIKLVDDNNRAIESMSSNFEMFKKQVLKSFSDLQSDFALTKSNIEKSVQTIGTDLNSRLEAQHFDNNVYSKQLSDSHSQLMTLKEYNTRLKDESFRVKKTNAELVAENSALKSEISQMKSRKMKDYTKSDNQALRSFRSSMPVHTASPAPKKQTHVEQLHDDTISDEAIAQALGQDGSEKQTLGSEETPVEPAAPPVNPWSNAVTSNLPSEVNPARENGQHTTNKESSTSTTQGKTETDLNSMPPHLGDGDTHGNVGIGAARSSSTCAEDISNVNDESSNDDSAFSAQPPERHQATDLLLKAETVTVHDSTPKHIDFRRFMKPLRSFTQRSSNTSKALKAIKSFPPNSKVKYAILHEGVNDATDKLPTEEIISNLKLCLSEMHTKFTNACIVYSEILFVGRDSRDSAENVAIKTINEELREFCTDNNFIYSDHPKLQSASCALFDDDKHIDKNGGTAVLVSDIYYASGFRQSRNQRENTTTYYNNNRKNQEMRPAQHFMGKVHDRNQQDGVNVNAILEMMCMNQRTLMSIIGKR